MILHELTPLGPFFAAAGAGGAAVTGALIAARHFGGTKGLVVTAAALALGIAVLPTLLLGDALDLRGSLRALVPVLAILAAFVGLHRPINSPARIARVTLIGAILGPLLLFGGIVFTTLAVVIITVVYLGRAARARQAG